MSSTHAFARTVATRFFLALIALCAGQVQAAPGYTYDLIYANGQFVGENLSVRHAGINNNGTVVFLTRAGAQWRVYTAARGQEPQLVFQSSDNFGTSTDPIIRSDWSIGINDDDFVAIGIHWPIFSEGVFTGFDQGFGIFEPGVGLIRELRGHPELSEFSGRLNSSLQLAGYERSGNTSQFVVTDGFSTWTADASGVPQIFSPIQINDSGVLTASVVTADGRKLIYRVAPPSAPQFVNIGFSPGLGYTTNLMATGINNRGWMSYVTNNDNSNNNPNPRVLLISPTGTITVVAESLGTNFLNFWQPRQALWTRGAAINNFNRVSFGAERTDLPGSGASIWIADASGDPPRLVHDADEVIRFADGRQFDGGLVFSDVTNLGVNSMNDAGEIAFVDFGRLLAPNGTQIASSINALWVARPTAGSEPGSPVFPEASDELPEGGWRFRGRCWRESVTDIAGSCDAFGGIGGETPRIWIDPPIAVGYDYTIDDVSSGAFTSVLVPAPLPGGDGEFMVEVNGAPAALQAGTPLYFNTITPDPVRTFRIIGIDQAETVDPNDPMAFVTGLTFAPNTNEDVSLTMIPVVFDPADGDSDGVPDAYDEFPGDPTKSGDPDGDGLDSNVDTDDDGDGVADDIDDYPWGRFTDSPPGSFAFRFIEALARAGITAGCGNGNYCPTEPVTRAQMAVFLERGKNGSAYVPPAATGTQFVDVAAGDFAAGFIEQLFADGITAGCGNGKYCPTGTVTREQMAVFLLRSKHGSAYVPPPANGVFSDVPPGSFASDWIEQLAAEGITAGCGGGKYCPKSPVSRDQMAVFLVRTFGL